MKSTLALITHFIKKNDYEFKSITFTLNNSKIIVFDDTKFPLLETYQYFLQEIARQIV